MLSMDHLLVDYKNNKEAIAAFNAPSMDVIYAIAEASRQTGSPAIIQYSSRMVEHYGAETLKSWFDTTSTNHSAKLYLHLDHCSKYDVIMSCIEAGWDMVMYDGSDLPFQENLSNTKHLANIAHQAGVAIEGELGGIGGEEDGIVHQAATANIEEIAQFCTETQVDCIAVGFGNVHGPYPQDKNLNWSILKTAGQVTDTPMVLHGGTGMSNAEMHKAILYGCSKINISTALKDCYDSLINESYSNKRYLGNPFEFHKTLQDRCVDICAEYICTFLEVSTRNNQ